MSHNFTIFLSYSSIAHAVSCHRTHGYISMLFNRSAILFRDYVEVKCGINSSLTPWNHAGKQSSTLQSPKSSPPNPTRVSLWVYTKFIQFSCKLIEDLPNAGRSVLFLMFVLIRFNMLVLIRFNTFINALL